MTSTPPWSPVRRRLTSVAQLVGALAALAIRRLTGLMPKRPDHWVFASRADAYADNPMYLFEHVHAYRADIRSCWLTGDRDLIKLLRAHGREAYHRWSPAGMWAATRAGVNVVASDASDTNFALTGGAVTLNLYHGLPLKRIEFDIEIGAAARAYHPTTELDWLRSRTLYAAKHTTTQLLPAPSDWTEEVFRRSFGGHLDEVVRACPPRVSAMVAGATVPEPLQDQRPFVDEIASTTDDVLLYVPTWRRTGLDVFRALGDREALELALADSDTVLVVKSHLHDATRIEPSARVRVASARTDVMALLTVADGLMTDFSSVAFDYALLGRPVLFVPYDLDEYIAHETGSFNLPYEELTADRRADSPEQLHEVIRSQRWHSWHIDPAVLELVWGPDPTAHGNETIVDAALTAAGRL